MFCRCCGKQIDDKSDCCPFCGGRVSAVRGISGVAPSGGGAPNGGVSYNGSFHSAPNGGTPYNAPYGGAQNNDMPYNAPYGSAPNNSTSYNAPYRGYGEPAQMFSGKRGGARGMLLSVLGALAAVAFVVCFIALSYDEPAQPDTPAITFPSTLDPPSPPSPPLPGDPGVIAGGDIAGVEFRDPYTVLKGDGSDTVTVMVYMVGSDLESDGGSATADIAEMLRADGSDGVNVVLETGGCSDWTDRRITDGQVERWLIEGKNLVKLDERGTARMLSVNELADFIGFCSESYPADRYGLIFWDHGGGSVYGFGYDELHPSDSLFLPDISNALERAGVKFDFVGFDACLMASVEVAYTLEPYADWLIASQETEPSTGWEYSSWLSELSDNPSLPTSELAGVIIRDYARTSEDTDTLSCISLREMPYVYDCLCAFIDDADALLAQGGFNFLSSSRAAACSFSYGEYDLVDIVDLARAMDTDSSEKLIKAVESAVKFRNDSAANGVHGLSMYYPYTDLDAYPMAKGFYRYIGFERVLGFFDGFIETMMSGRTGEADSLFPLGGLGGAYVASGFETVADGSGGYVVPVSPEQWEEIVSVELSLVVDDGDGYIDLGSDAVFYTDDNDNLVPDFDGTWVAVGGCVVPSYAQSTVVTDDSTVFVSTVSALLNGEQEIELELRWIDSVDNGYIAGYRAADSGSQGALGKLLQLKQGDTLEFVCDRYGYDGSFEGREMFGEGVTVGSRMPAVTYERTQGDRLLVCYRISDVYQNIFYTDMVEVE